MKTSFSNFSGVVRKENIYMILCQNENAVFKFLGHSVDWARVYDGSVSQAGCSILISILVELCYNSIETWGFV